ncbi:MAG TPA: hypothetical protein VFF82_11885 [Rhodocyclaceae bacterium]|nr:hypothetical protein [Rhodocyclaceae bacterium]
MRQAAILLASMALCACSTTEKAIPSSGTLLPNASLKVSPSISVALEKIVIWGTLAGAAYLVLDPLAPNWKIEEAPLGDSHIHFSLQMKRFYTGGAGEARAVFNRRAKELMRLNDYDGYQVVEYSESLNSSVLGSQRTAEGVIRLTRKRA